MGFKHDLPSYGVTAENAWENLLTYSIIASQSLDYAAGAASAIDLEAGRCFRMAQNFLRARVDVLLTQLIWGEAVKIDGDVWRFRLSSRPFKPFGEIFLATSSDKAAMKDDLAATSGFLEEGPGFHGMGGDLIRDAASIMEAERRWHEVPIESMAIAVTDEQKAIMGALQRAAATTEEFLRHGMLLLRMKLDGKKRKFFCSCCGLPFELPVDEGCPLCKANASAISPLPFAPVGNLKKIYED